MRTLNLFVATIGIFSIHSIYALPSSARLFQAKYGYKTSCLLCHANGGGSENNAYGKAYLRAGGNLGAFAKLESRDSDDDGIPNLKEILAKSNPGKKESTPTSPGDWLANAGSIFIPQKQLEQLFTGVDKFSAIEGALNANQSETLKTKTGHDPLDDDKVPTFYFAEKDGKKVAVAQLMTSKNGDNTLTSGIAVATNGKIQSTKIFSTSKGLVEPGAFASSLKDKDMSGVAALSPKDESEKLLLDSAKRSLALMAIVFGGAK